MAQILIISSRTAHTIQSWLEAGWTNEPEAPDEAVDAAVALGNLIGSIATSGDGVMLTIEAHEDEE